MAEISFDEWLDLRVPDGIAQEEVLLGADEAEQPIIETRWSVRDDRGADWVMRKLRKAQLEVEEHLAVARAERERIDEWLDAVNGPLLRDVEHWTGLLQRYAQLVIEERLLVAEGEWARVRPKTIKLPHGEIAVRRSSAGTFATSDNGADAAVRWAIERDLALDLLHFPEPKVRATELDAAVEAGRARVTANGSYEVLVEIGPTSWEVYADAVNDPARFVLSDDDVTWYEWQLLPGVQRLGIGEISYSVKADTSER